MGDAPGGQEVHSAAAVGFDRAADEYERARPGYPEAALAEIVRVTGMGPETTVCDLAAGTGKLTRMLVATGADVVAVEPVAGMRAAFERAVPGVDLVDGTAEDLPLPDASIDVLTVAQAAHWFDLPAFGAEALRVVRPGGWLVLLWNERDESVPWIGAMTELVVQHGGGRPYTRQRDWPQALSEVGWPDATSLRFDNPQEATADLVVDRVASTSFIAALADAPRQAALDAVRDLLASDPATAGHDRFAFPHVTDVHLARRPPLLAA